MSKSFQYVAMKDGILSPHRRVKKGQKVSSPIELDASWLAPVVDGKPVPRPVEIPAVPYLHPPKQKNQVSVTDMAVPEKYRENMENIKRHEKGADLDDDDKILAVRAAIAALNKDDKSNFNADGKPNAKVLAQAVGFVVTTEIRDAALALSSGDSEGAETGDDTTEAGTGNQDVI